MRIGDAIDKGVRAVTKDWTTYRKKQFRDAARATHYREKMMRGRVLARSIKEIAYGIMPDAYMKASGRGTLPAQARQIMYQARPLILGEAEKPLGKDFDQYFTQQLLPKYMAEHPRETASWDVVFDARGHLWEPHTGREIQLGTLAVRSYIAALSKNEIPKLEMPSVLTSTFPTHGPSNRFRNVLFIEKEGFMPLLEQARIQERYDLAIMSTKGLASTAARTLMEHLVGVRFLVLHDFDKAGFSIVGTLRRDTARFQFESLPDVIDLGLRLEDVKVEGLGAEPVHYTDRDPRWNLRENGATDAEIKFLVTGTQHGQRVELNALTSDRFIAWLEGKLAKHGVKKIRPDDAVLAAAYQRAVYTHRVNDELEKIHAEARAVAEAAKIPKGLRREISRLLQDDSTLAWDAAVARMAPGMSRSKHEARGSRHRG